MWGIELAQDIILGLLGAVVFGALIALMGKARIQEDGDGKEAIL